MVIYSFYICASLFLLLILGFFFNWLSALEEVIRSTNTKVNDVRCNCLQMISSIEHIAAKNDHIFKKMNEISISLNEVLKPKPKPIAIQRQSARTVQKTPLS